MARMEWYDWLALSLVTIGAINWGLMLLDFNLVTALFRSWAPGLISIVYALVGLAGLYSLWFMVKQAL